MDNIKLLPCPFCGSPAKLTDHGKGTGGWMISCHPSCGVIMTSCSKNPKLNIQEIHDESKGDVIRNWNRRKELNDG